MRQFLPITKQGTKVMTANVLKSAPRIAKPAKAKIASVLSVIVQRRENAEKAIALIKMQRRRNRL